MINSNELRIGNLFYPIDKTRDAHIPIPTAYLVLEISAFEISAIKLGENPAKVKEWSYFKTNEISPIRLTTELVEKAGFEYLCKDDLGGWATYIIRRKAMSSDVIINFGIAGENFYVKHSNHAVAYCLYLHQLQNLYFSLTGKELEIVKECDATAAEERIFAALKKKYRISTDY